MRLTGREKNSAGNALRALGVLRRNEMKYEPKQASSAAKTCET
jgi:hypothetical protein